MYVGRELFQDQGKPFLDRDRLKPFLFFIAKKIQMEVYTQERRQTLLPLSESVFLLLLLLLLSSLSLHNLHGLK